MVRTLTWLALDDLTDSINANYANEAESMPTMPTRRKVCQRGGKYANEAEGMKNVFFVGFCRFL
ncbi:hypothetical protein [uncultured Gammaproteobacteria bacterium]|nr:hypothetical protein [uncultured Gammaproteobacteria bacterium]